MAENQDDLAAEWGMALAEQGVAPKGATAADGSGAEGGDDMAAQWAAMIEDGGQFVQAGGNKGGAERILNQEEIDSLLGFNLADMSGGKRLIIATAAFRNEPYQ